MPEAAPPRPASFVTGRPVAVLVVTVATVVFGWFSLQQLPVALMPELSYPTLTVRTEYPGAAPEEVENDISRPLEEALGVIGGLSRISSVSRAGVSDVVLELAWDTDMSEAAQDTLEKLDLVFLPDEAERPLILRYDPSLDPVMELSLAGSGDRFAGEEGLRRLRRLADREVKRALEPIKGVAAVRVRGGLEEEILVAIDEDKLRRSGLAVETVARRLAQENVNVAGGTIKEGRTEYMVRTLNEYVDLGEIRDTVVASTGGREVRLRDLAEVSWSHEEQQMLTRTEGGVSVQIDVFKEADANIVDLASRVKERLGKLDPAAEAARDAGTAPAPKRGWGPSGSGPGGGGEKPAGLATELYRSEGATLAVVADRSLFIESSIDEVKSSAIEGAILAVLVLILFLRNAWTTLIVAVSIPVSLLISFAPLQLAGTSLNIMSLGGLALGVGMLVDASIVVIESIFRCREEGDDVVAAAERGIREVRAAVISTVLTTIAVFFPMVFVEGIAGQAFGDLGLAVTVSLLASMLVAIYLVPMLASRRGLELPASAARPGPVLARRSLFRLGSVAALRQDAAGLGRWVRPAGEGGDRHLSPLRLLAAPLAGLYLALRLVLGLVLEILAKLALAVVLGLLWLARGAYGLARAAALAIGRRVAALRAPGESAAGAERAGMARLREGYERSVRWAVGHPAAMAGVVVAMFALSIAIGSGLDSELLPEVHQGELTFEVALPVGTPLAETEAALAPVERAILAERQHIRALILTVGFDPETSRTSDEGEHTARFKLLLDSSEPQVEQAVVERVRRRLASVPDASVRVVRPVLFSFKTPIEVEIYGDDLARLKRTTDEVREVMAGLSELADVESTLKTGAPEVEIVYDRDLLARYGLNIRQVALEIRNQVKGTEATRFNLKDRRIPVVVRLGEADRETVADVEDLIVNPGAERPIPLSAVAQVKLAEGPSEVRRIDGRRVAVVGANLSHGLAGGSLGGAVAAIEREVSERIDWPADMTFLIAGQNEEWERSRGSLVLALALSIFLVYVIMAAQFESLLQPLVILFTIPLALFGTVLTLQILGLSVSIVVFLGAILLVGIVVDNAIVLVDYINVLRQRGYALEEAIVTAGTVRFRPILMTTLTTVLGLVPMALGLGDGAEIRRPMAIAVISGMVSSTALTLLIIPSLYALVERAKARVLGRRTGLEPDPASVGGPPPAEIVAGAQGPAR